MRQVINKTAYLLGFYLHNTVNRINLLLYFNIYVRDNTFNNLKFKIYYEQNRFSKQHG